MPTAQEEKTRREEASQQLPEAQETLEENEKEAGEIYLDVTYPEEATPEKKPLRIRAEVVMGIIAAFAAVLVLVLVMLCWPFFQENEDPEALLHAQSANRATQPPKETILEPTVPETEPEKPTIPPDPNPYDRYDFQYNRHNYLLLQNVDSIPGIDVSANQGAIYWEHVA